MSKKCVCNELRKNKSKVINIDDWSTGPYVSLTMSYGNITAHGEDNAYCGISFCPFCGREFKFNK